MCPNAEVALPWGGLSQWAGGHHALLQGEMPGLSLLLLAQTLSDYQLVSRGTAGLGGCPLCQVMGQAFPACLGRSELAWHFFT